MHRGQFKISDIPARAAPLAALGIGLCDEVAGIAGGSAVFLLPFSEKLTLSGRQAAEQFNTQATGQSHLSSQRSS